MIRKSFKKSDHLPIVLDLVGTISFYDRANELLVINNMAVNNILKFT